MKNNTYFFCATVSDENKETIVSGTFSVSYFDYNLIRAEIVKTVLNDEVREAFGYDVKENQVQITTLNRV